MRRTSDQEAVTRAKLALMEDIAGGALTVAQAVKRMRKITGLTQLEFARKVAGVTVRTLNEIETGKANPTVETLNKIAGPFGYQVGLVRKNL